MEHKTSIVPKQVCNECDQQFDQWWVDIDKVLLVDVERGEFSKMDFVEAAKQVGKLDSQEKWHSHNTARCRNSKQPHRAS